MDVGGRPTTGLFLTVGYRWGYKVEEVFEASPAFRRNGFGGRMGCLDDFPFTSEMLG